MKVEIKVDKEKCKGCELCINVCPVKILHLSKDFNQNGNHYIIVNDSLKCKGCGFCYMICPDAAITVIKEG